MIIIQATSVLSAVHFTLVRRTLPNQLRDQHVQEFRTLAALDCEPTDYWSDRSLALSIYRLIGCASAELGGSEAKVWEDVL